MIFRFGFLVVAASAAALLSHHKHRSSVKKLPLEKDESSLKHADEERKFADILSAGKTETEKSNKLTSRNYGESEFSDTVKNVKKADRAYLSRTSVKELENKKLSLEKRLIEQNGQTKYWSSISQLKRDLEEKIKVIQMLNLTIRSLKAARNDLEKEHEEGILAAKQLEEAKRMMQKMQRGIDAKGNNLKGQLLILQHQVSGFQSSEASNTDSKVEQKLKGIELELFELERENKELQLGKRELVVKLFSTQARIAALSNLTENEVIGKINDEISTLKHTNEDLLKQVETLQTNRFAMVEELVYHRWLNTCLRFEIQDHKTPSKKPSNRDTKTDSIIRLDFNLDITSSHSSSTDSSNDNDSSSMMSSSSSSQRSITKKSGFMHRLKKWGAIKDDYSAVASQNRSSSSKTSSRKGLIRRFSTSMVPTKPSTGNSPGNENLNPNRRVRRVSFNDAVRTIEPITPESVSDSASEIDSDRPSHTSLLNVAENKHGFWPQSSDVAKESELDVNEKEGNEDNNLDAKMNSRNKYAESNLEELHDESISVQHIDDKVDIHMLNVAVVLLLMLLLLLLPISVER